MTFHTHIIQVEPGVFYSKLFNHTVHTVFFTKHQLLIVEMSSGSIVREEHIESTLKEELMEVVNKSFKEFQELDAFGRRTLKNIYGEPSDSGYYVYDKEAQKNFGLTELMDIHYNSH